MYQLRIYTLRTAEVLQVYATAHWPRHISSLQSFGVTTHGFWTEHAPDAHRLLALISFPSGTDPVTVTTTYMESPAFRADMEGFDITNITDVVEIFLDRAAGSPLA